MATQIDKSLHRFSYSGNLLIVPAIGAFFFLFVLPLSKLFWISLNKNGSLSRYSEILSKRVFIDVFVNTVNIAFVVALVTIVVCFPVAYSMRNYKGRKALLLLGLVMLPFWMSILVRSFAWVVVLQKEGILNRCMAFIGVGTQDLLYNRFSVVVGMVYVFIPYVILILYSSFKRVNVWILNTGRTLGTNSFENFYLLFLPQIKNALLFAFIYVFVISLGYFITPALLGGAKETTISMLIDTEMNQTLNWSRGAALSFLVLFVIIPLLAVAVIFFKK